MQENGLNWRIEHGEIYCVRTMEEMREWVTLTEADVVQFANDSCGGVVLRPLQARKLLQVFGMDALELKKLYDFDTMKKYNTQVS